jgi:methylenetetrahydrofolate--tRNA-(uracil-5-)-methyltransferase
MKSRQDTPTQLVVVGGGLAGCEAAWQASRRGVEVVLYDMKPERLSPAHTSEDLAELVCSNSLRASPTHNAVGLLKEEMRCLGSLILEAADANAVPAGRALAVDRTGFAQYVTRAIEENPRIELRRELVSEIPKDPLVVLATGPLTAPELARDLQRMLGDEYLYFYDAIAPTLYADSIDHSVVFRASRYEEGEGDYLNVPLNAEQYHDFVRALLEAEKVPLHKFEKALYFEGCLPIEEMARRGVQTLAFGPMKPVGLIDPRTGKRSHAVVQLRQEDQGGVLFNLVGFQTKLRIGEQKRIFRTLPGLEKAVFARFGSVHRNTYVNAPLRLDPSLELKARKGLYLAGQMAGVEGYVESAALGGIAGTHAARAAWGLSRVEIPPDTAHGALFAHLGNSSARDFQPMNVNFGLFPPLERSEASGRPRKQPKREKHEAMAARGLLSIERFRAAVAPEGG